MVMNMIERACLQSYSEKSLYSRSFSPTITRGFDHFSRLGITLATPSIGALRFGVDSSRNRIADNRHAYGSSIERDTLA